MKILSGLPVSPGIVKGTAFHYGGATVPEVPRYRIPATQVEAEKIRLRQALCDAVQEIQALTQATTGESADIFTVQRMMLEDDEFTNRMFQRLSYELMNVEWVVWESARELAQKLANSPDSYFQERVADIRDVARRVITLLDSSLHNVQMLEHEVILIVHDLLPSELLSLDRTKIKGIATDVGGRTSHMAIMAAAFGIPTVVGFSHVTKEVLSGQTVLLNANSGELIVEPDKQTLANHLKNQHTLYESEYIDEGEAETLDGYRITLNANIEIVEESSLALHFGAEGIGLFRSEFLFLSQNNLPTEEEQYHAYRHVVQAMKGRTVTIRTLDIGGDKLFPEYPDANEKNPLLGWRAIRFCLSMPELFKTQIRAILRANIEGTIQILLPMISGIEELEQAKTLIASVQAEQHYASPIRIGSMIEIPSAAITADLLAQHCDFFSIGTNDLLQYSLAVDRNNEKVNYLANPFHPAMLRLIKYTVEAADTAGIPLSLCGELAGELTALPLLIGLGLNTLSMNSRLIPRIKHSIRTITKAQCYRIAQQALGCVSAEEVKHILEDSALDL
ncbi:MAG: phosphoenolpyruvate--protein phosphotransferase [Treponema sp.]|jgi:phosphotransferase system enzyme I (PtsI)|nr:phosphoenolpyruvate--protein phosphotransferase [Treponema sp.]